MFNKVCFAVAVLVCVFGLFSSVASAGTPSAPAAATGDKIGVIDSQTVITQHPKFESAMKELQNVSKKKEDEARAAADKEPDNAKKTQIYNTKRMEYAKEEQRLMEPIFQDAQLAVRTVAKNKGLTVVLEKASVYFGGVDITEDVVQQVKKQDIGKK